jgi:hypothetical protein
VQEILDQDENLPLMLLHAHRGDDSKWWIVDPGWGVKVTKYVACGRTGPDDEDHSNLANMWWFVPWDAQLASQALRCHHGATWLHDFHSACMAGEIEQMNNLLQGAIGGDSAPTNEATVAGTDEADTENLDETDTDWKPKAGSLNHKCAMIVAVESGDWQRLYQLIRVLLILSIPLISTCFWCVVLVSALQLYLYMRSVCQLCSFPYACTQGSSATKHWLRWSTHTAGQLRSMAGTIGMIIDECAQPNG